MKVDELEKGGMFIALAAISYIPVFIFDTDYILTPFNWIGVGLAATGLAYFVSFVVSLFTKKDPRAWVLPVFPLFAAAVTGIAIYFEGKEFMGYLGQGLIFWAFTFPLIITAVIWAVVSIAGTVKKMSALEKQVDKLNAAQSK